jgi:hypothetical protein
MRGGGWEAGHHTGVLHSSAGRQAKHMECDRAALKPQSLRVISCHWCWDCCGVHLPASGGCVSCCHNSFNRQGDREKAKTVLYCTVLCMRDNPSGVQLGRAEGGMRGEQNLEKPVVLAVSPRAAPFSCYTSLV